MRSIIFKNQGEIDRLAITTIGASIKQEGAIGFFGTGLKYALAILIRNGCTITIYSGEKQYVVGSKKTKIRDKSFDIITINNRRTEFTTELGKTWEMWQAFRELYCNCMDEGGVSYLSIEDELPEKGVTKIIVTGQAFIDEWMNKDATILRTECLSEAPCESTQVDIYNEECKHVYFKSIKAHTPSDPALLTYNVKSGLTLTEDRTIKDTWSLASVIRSAIMKLTDDAIIERILTADKSTYEGVLDFSYSSPSDRFLAVVKDLFARKIPINPTALSLIKSEIPALMRESSPHTLNKIEERQLEKAIKFCKSLGFNVDDYPIVISEHLGDGVMGQAIDDSIFIAANTFNIGTKALAGTLFEEWVHLKYHFYDETRSMQNYLIDKIMSMGELLNNDTV